MATKKNLLALAAAHDVEVDPKSTNGAIELALIEAGIDPNSADVVAPLPVEAAPALAETDEEVVMKMERQNWSYETSGYLFSQEHPFQVVKKSHVEHLIREGGFRLATESELREYYG